jgi:hypothetical protein
MLKLVNDGSIPSKHALAIGKTTPGTPLAIGKPTMARFKCLIITYIINLRLRPYMA